MLRTHNRPVHAILFSRSTVRVACPMCCWYYRYYSQCTLRHPHRPQTMSALTALRRSPASRAAVHAVRQCAATFGG